MKLAAETKLNTTQPSLSRQIRDLEAEVGAALLVRGSRGVALTPAGRAFLDHARVMLSQAEAAIQSAREVANPARPSFALGFMIGHDSTWIPEALRLLHTELPDLHVVISTQNSPQLGSALSLGSIDVAFLRKDDGGPGLRFRHLIDEPFQVFLPKRHTLAKRSAIAIQDLVTQTFIGISGIALGVSGKPPALRQALDRYLKEARVDIKPSHEVDSLGAVMSLIVSTQGVALLPAYAATFLPETVTVRPIRGVAPTIDLSAGYREANHSPVLKLFLGRLDQFVTTIRA